jgi:maltooligosyltrehalose trehalohydrolase
LIRFVDACHRRGLGVLIDAVFNHLGPSGNYLPRFGPYLSSASNPWGEGINIADAQSDEVRRYIIDCALRWMRDFHADGLRLDAVHALFDTTAIHILEELAAETDALAAQLGRPLSLVAESDLNDPRMVTPRSQHGQGMTAQWDDDIHHAIHTAVSGERQGYYADFGSLATLATTLRHGFFHAATYSSFRQRRHGRPLDTTEPSGIPATRLLAYTCTHDQVGNRALGDRPSQNLTYGQLAVKAALVLASPYTVMLFMGEEWGASTPFQFFSSHPEPELARATAEGRKREFAGHGWDADDIPNPQDLQTFQRSKLDWSELDRADHAKLLAVYRALIALRRSESNLRDPWLDNLDVRYDEAGRWIALYRGTLTVACNLGTEPVPVPFTGEVVLSSEPITAGEQRTELPSQSFVILRTVDS